MNESIESSDIEVGEEKPCTVCRTLLEKDWNFCGQCGNMKTGLNLEGKVRVNTDKDSGKVGLRFLCDKAKINKPHKKPNSCVNAVKIKKDIIKTKKNMLGLEELPLSRKDVENISKYSELSERNARITELAHIRILHKDKIDVGQSSVCLDINDVVTDGPVETSVFLGPQTKQNSKVKTRKKNKKHAMASSSSASHLSRTVKDVDMSYLDQHGSVTTMYNDYVEREKLFDGFNAVSLEKLDTDVSMHAHPQPENENGMGISSSVNENGSNEPSPSIGHSASWYWGKNKPGGENEGDSDSDNEEDEAEDDIDDVDAVEKISGGNRYDYESKANNIIHTTDFYGNALDAVDEVDSMEIGNDDCKSKNEEIGGSDCKHKQYKGEKGEKQDEEKEMKSSSAVYDDAFPLPVDADGKEMGIAPNRIPLTKQERMELKSMHKQEEKGIGLFWSSEVASMYTNNEKDSSGSGSGMNLSITGNMNDGTGSDGEASGVDSDDDSIELEMFGGDLDNSMLDEPQPQGKSNSDINNIGNRDKGNSMTSNDYMLIPHINYNELIPSALSGGNKLPSAILSKHFQRAIRSMKSVMDSVGYINYIRDPLQSHTLVISIRQHLRLLKESEEYGRNQVDIAENEYVHIQTELESKRRDSALRVAAAYEKISKVQSIYAEKYIMEQELFEANRKSNETWTTPHIYHINTNAKMDRIQKHADKRLSKYGENLQILQNNEAILLKNLREAEFTLMESIEHWRPQYIQHKNDLLNKLTVLDAYMYNVASLKITAFFRYVYFIKTSD